MERIEKTVFLSYRRTNFPWALAIYKELTHSGYDVFIDYLGISAGDFESVILGNITSRAHFLILLTPSALDRCGEPGDWLRREIETALESRRNVVPLMLEGFDFGSPVISGQLSGKLAELKKYNGVSIVPEYVDAAMDRLRKFLHVPLSAVPHPATTGARDGAAEQKAAADAAPAVQKKELTAQEWFERGIATIDQDEELLFFSEAIRLKPDFARAFNNRGYARFCADDLEGAIRDYNEAIRLKPDFAKAFNNRGMARYFKFDFEGAIQDYNEAIRIKPDYINAIYNRAMAHRRRDGSAAAVADYQRYLDLGGGLRDGDRAEVEARIRGLRESLVS